MKAEYEKLITEHDKTLSLLRSNWLGSVDDREKFRPRLDEGLDERLRLMKLRDTACHG